MADTARLLDRVEARSAVDPSHEESRGRAPRLIASAIVTALVAGIVLGAALTTRIAPPPASRAPRLTVPAPEQLDEPATQPDAPVPASAPARARAASIDQSTVAPPDNACVWDPHTLIGATKRPRPFGPLTAFHCSPREGPLLAEGPRIELRKGVMTRFLSDFDAIFNMTATLKTGGNPAFRCTTDCGEGPDKDWTEHFGAAFVSVEGTVHSRGYEGHVSLMSQSKVVAFMLAIQALGISKVQEYVSAEPSGRSFGDFTTMGDHRAFNPYVSTGAEIVWALLDAATPGQYRETIDLNRKTWARLSAGVGGEVRLKQEVGDALAEGAIWKLPPDPKSIVVPSNSVNLATIYVMAARLAAYGGLPPNATIEGTYQGFVQVNNLRLTMPMMATAAATLANGGVNPLTGDRVLTGREVRYLLTTMTMAGLYDGSGRWAFTVGMPAKSGVAGGLIVVAPGVGGFATVSEPLDQQGNSARGVAFFHGLAHRFPHLHGWTPGAGSDPNLALTPQEECELVTKTIQQRPGLYTPD